MIVFIGAFAQGEHFINLVLLIAFGFVGLSMARYGFSRPALLLGFVLGDLLEKYLFLGVRTDGPFFFMTPVGLSMIGLIIVAIAFGPLTSWLRSKLGTRGK